MLGSCKSKAKLLLMLAEAGWDPVGRFFVIEDNILFPSPQHLGFQPRTSCPCQTLCSHSSQLSRQQDQGDPAGCPAQALAYKVLWIGKPSPERDKAAVRALRKALTSWRRGLGGVGAKSDPSVAKTNPDTGSFLL